MASEQIIKEYFQPAELEVVARSLTWDDVRGELKAHLEADAARPSTVHDYLDTLKQIQGITADPASISVKQAQRWCNDYLVKRYSRAKKPGAKTYQRSPRTLHARVRKLKAIWGKYLIKRMKLADENPWASVDLPRLDGLPVRTLSADQVNTFFAWLDVRWKGWTFPGLFFEAKAVTGCRLGDLCQLRSDDLKNGRLTFRAELAKVRRHRVAVLPSDLYAALNGIAGPTYLWESYAARMKVALADRGLPTNRVIAEFDRRRLSWWAKDEIASFNRAYPDAPKIKSHDFRKRAITEAHRAGLDVDTAAAAVGMSSTTARGYYLAIDQDASSELMTAKLGAVLRPNREAKRA